MTKKELRAQIAQAVSELSGDYCRTADEAIRRHILESEMYQKAETLFCYVGVAREIDTAPFVRAALAAGKRVAVPLCVGKGIMEARAIQSMEDLVPGKYDIPAPAPHCPVVEPEAFDLIIVPCSTGNAKGQRLGYGGGFYDRYLPRTRCPKVLLCREKLVREDIPVEEHDLILDYLITEAGLISCGE